MLLIRAASVGVNRSADCIKPLITERSLPYNQGCRPGLTSFK
jgi:hypothetical protein